jgi:hypothetical protein
MEAKTFYSFIIAISLILFISIYWFIPLNRIEFNLSPNSNFSLNNSENSTLQFYSSMRFPEESISYKIEGCSLKRLNDMEEAFDLVEKETILDFYPVEYGQEITITCKDTIEIEGNLFTAGEGGPTNVTIIDGFNIIESGKILLLRDSTCERPNIAIHELLHVLGFTHSENRQNIMYKISECDQTMGDDLIDFINEIYAIPNQPDLLFENASVVMRGKYLDINFSIRNNGLRYSEESILRIMVDGKEVEEMKISPIEMGEGIRGYMKNILIKQISINNIDFIIDSNFEELNKLNNEISFEIKK